MQVHHSEKVRVEKDPVFLFCRIWDSADSGESLYVLKMIRTREYDTSQEK